MAVNANHIGSVSQGYVFAHAEIIHKGVNSHIWNITISDDGGRAVSICRFTNMILKK
jgi:1,4-dihydroxy-2-naphthoyl-CoA hydrolase